MGIQQSNLAQKSHQNDRLNANQMFYLEEGNDKENENERIYSQNGEQEGSYDHCFIDFNRQNAKFLHQASSYDGIFIDDADQEIQRKEIQKSQKMEDQDSKQPSSSFPQEYQRKSSVKHMAIRKKGEYKNKSTLLKNEKRYSSINEESQTFENAFFGEIQQKKDSEGDLSMRNQNNCKYFHKLLKNHLKKMGLYKYMQDLDNKFHARYYFIIALDVLKRYGGEKDFTKKYQLIVQKQLHKIQNKIQNKKRQIKVSEEKLSDIEKKQAKGSEEWKNITSKIKKMVKQLHHWDQIRIDIGVYSVKSCKQFFNGNIELALRILYQKNDKVIKKEYYFVDGLNIIMDRLSLTKTSRYSPIQA